MIHDGHTAKGFQQIKVGKATKEIGFSLVGSDSRLIAGIVLGLAQQDVVLAYVTIVAIPNRTALGCRSTAIAGKAADIGILIHAVVTPARQVVVELIGSSLELVGILKHDGFGTL